MLMEKNTFQAKAKHLLFISFCANAKGKKNLKSISKQAFYQGAILLVEKKTPIHLSETKR